MLKLKSSNARMGTGASAQARSAELRTSLWQLYEKVEDAIRAEAREVEETNEHTVDAEVHRTEASKSSRRAHRFQCQTVKRSVQCSLLLMLQMYGKNNNC